MRPGRLRNSAASGVRPATAQRLRLTFTRRPRVEAFFVTASPLLKTIICLTFASAGGTATTASAAVATRAAVVLRDRSDRIDLHLLRRAPSGAVWIPGSRRLEVKSTWRNRDLPRSRMTLLRPSIVTRRRPPLGSLRPMSATARPWKRSRARAPVLRERSTRPPQAPLRFSRRQPREVRSRFRSRSSIGTITLSLTSALRFRARSTAPTRNS